MKIHSSRETHQEFVSQDEKILGKSAGSCRQEQIAFDGAAVAEQDATGLFLAAKGDSVRWNKIVSIQRALADGTYSVKSAEVARKIIDRMLAR